MKNYCLLNLKKSDYQDLFTGPLTTTSQWLIHHFLSGRLQCETTNEIDMWLTRLINTPQMGQETSMKFYTMMAENIPLVLFCKQVFYHEMTANSSTQQTEEVYIAKWNQITCSCMFKPPMAFKDRIFKGKDYFKPIFRPSCMNLWWLEDAYYIMALTLSLKVMKRQKQRGELMFVLRLHSLTLHSIKTSSDWN